MSGDNFTIHIPKIRPVLGDVTNLPVKRDFSLIGNDLEAKSNDVCVKKYAYGGDEYSKLPNNKPCISTINKGVDSDKALMCLGDDNNKKSIDSSDTDTDDAIENKKRSNLVEQNVNLVKNVADDGDESRDNSYASLGSMSCKKDDGIDDGMEKKSAVRVCLTFVNKDLGVGSQSETVESPRLSQSQGGSRSFELDRCTVAKGDACTNLYAGADLLKSCSCSFCLKAAHIWADLHYQDINGRINALKKSQKEASILVNKYAREKQTDIYDQGNSSKSLESDLTAQWRSLFLHMEDIFAHESNQHQIAFTELKDLREKCKTDLMKIDEAPSDKH